jgi:WD40 repeat protein
MPVELQQTLAAHRDVLRLAFSPDARTLATAGYDPGNVGNSIKLWDANSWSLLHRLKGHKGNISAIAFSQDGSKLVSAGLDGTLRMWKVASGEQPWAARRHQGVVFGVALSPDGRLVASGGRDARLLICDAATGDVLHQLKSERSVLSVDFSPDGKTLASADGLERKAAAVRLWSVAAGEVVAMWTGHSDWPLWVKFSPDGSSIASGSYRELLIRAGSTGDVFNTLTMAGSSMAAFALSPDGKTVAAGGWEHSTRMKEVPGGWVQLEVGRIQIWNLQTGETIASLAAHERSVSAIAFSPDSRLVGTASRDGTVKIWNLGV